MTYVPMDRYTHMTTSTPPAWHWLDECEVPAQAYQWMTPKTPSEAELSFGTPKTPDSATLRERNDSNPDPTYRDCWPSERYPSDGPERAVGATESSTFCADQCPECRCPPDMPHNAECDEAAKVTDSVINAAPEHVESYVSEGSREHVGPVTVESCPECCAVTDLDYGPESVLLPKRESGAAEETCIDDNPLLNHMECTFNSCMDTAVAKNEGYAGSADPMANFNDSVRLGVPVPIGVAIRLGDKWARLCRLLQTGENPLADESITDTIMDSINYLAILLYALSPATASQDEDTALCGKAGLVTSAHS